MYDVNDPDRRLRDVDRLPAGIGPTAVFNDLLDDVGAQITARHGPARRRVWKSRTLFTARRGVFLAWAAGLIVVGGAAAATTLLTTYTGKYNTGWEAKAGGPGELLLMGAPNFCQAALKVSSDIPYPSGEEDWRTWVLVSELDQPKVTPGACGANASGGEGHTTETSTGEVRGYFAMSAFCAWVYDWRQSEADRDGAAADEAGSVIASALSWKAVTAEDPDPTAAALKSTHHGLDGNHSLFGWFIPFQQAVHSDNVSRVSDLIASNYGTAGCSYFSPPKGSHRGTQLPAKNSHGHTS